MTSGVRPQSRIITPLPSCINGYLRDRSFFMGWGGGGLVGFDR